jgi:hypothetical protein
MGRRPPDRSRIDLDMLPPRALPAAHFDRNKVPAISGTGHKHLIDRLAQNSGLADAARLEEVRTAAKQLSEADLSVLQDFVPYRFLTPWLRSALVGVKSGEDWRLLGYDSLATTFAMYLFGRTNRSGLRLGPLFAMEFCHPRLDLESYADSRCHQPRQVRCKAGFRIQEEAAQRQLCEKPNPPCPSRRLTKHERNESGTKSLWIATMNPSDSAGGTAISKKSSGFRLVPSASPRLRLRH